jgi:hypothetical protein
MSPTHANKLGVHYRYYVSQALLQNRKAEAGSIARVPAPEIESLVRDGVRRHLAAIGDAEPPTAVAERDLIERHVAMAQQSSGELASTDPTKGEEAARVQACGIHQKSLSVQAATQNTFNVQRHLTSARIHRAFRTSALQTWREVVAAA